MTYFLFIIQVLFLSQLSYFADFIHVFHRAQVRTNFPVHQKFSEKNCVYNWYHLALLRFCLHLADLHKQYITCQLLKIFWWILLEYIQTFSHVLLLKYIDLNQTLDIQDFIQNGIVVNNYTQEQNFTLFYQSIGLDTMRI